MFSGQIVVPLVCWTLSATRFFLGVACVIILTLRGLLAFESTYKWLVTLVLTLGALVDAMLAAAFCYKLSARRTGRAGYAFHRSLVLTVLHLDMRFISSLDNS